MGEEQTGRVDLGELVGREGSFYGAHSNMFRLDGTTYEVVEDEDDGYRSSMDYVREVPDGAAGFFVSSFANARVEEGDCRGLYRLVDTSDGHVWLEFGTEDIDDYYPGFIFRYTPKAGE